MSTISAGTEAIREAIILGNTEILEFLLENGAPVNGFMNYRFGIWINEDTNLFLTKAAEDNHLLCTESLIKHGANVRQSILFARHKYDELNKKNQYYLRVSYSDETRQDKISKGEAINDFDISKTKILERIEQANKSFYLVIKTLLDYSVGIDFGKISAFTQLDLSDIDVTDFNFIGVSFNGKPVTTELLTQLGVKNAEKALTTLEQLTNLTDKNRQEKIRTRLLEQMAKLGIEVDQTNHINFVPLKIAAEIGDEKTVVTRLSMKNPSVNKTTDDEISQALIVAANKGFTNIAQMLARHPMLDKKYYQK